MTTTPKDPLIVPPGDTPQGLCVWVWVESEEQQVAGLSMVALRKIPMRLFCNPSDNSTHILPSTVSSAYRLTKGNRDDITRPHPYIWCSLQIQLVEMRESE